MASRSNMPNRSRRMPAPGIQRSTVSTANPSASSRRIERAAGVMASGAVRYALANAAHLHDFPGSERPRRFTLARSKDSAV